MTPPRGDELPLKGFDVENLGFQPPSEEGKNVNIAIDPNSDRLQLLEPFLKWNEEDICNLSLLIKAKGKCTTDHISMAGPWLKYRGHLQNISKNLLIGATNAFNDKTNLIKNKITKEYDKISNVAEFYKKNNIFTIVVGDENYGEGSSREHAAMEPRFMNVKVVVVKSFARIHETNLKKQGVLALTFKDKVDYDKILEDDSFNIIGLKEFSIGSTLKLEALHVDGSRDDIELLHTYNENQIEWFKAGSALNLISKQ